RRAPSAPRVGVPATRSFSSNVCCVSMMRHASSADEKPSIWSMISSSILMILSTRSSASETSVVVIFPSSPLEKNCTRQRARAQKLECDAPENECEEHDQNGEIDGWDDDGEGERKSYQQTEPTASSNGHFGAFGMERFCEPRPLRKARAARTHR